MSIDFASLWNAYPTGSRKELFTELGGGWPALIDSENFKNTCALRLSVAMIAVGQVPPVNLVKIDGNLKTGDNKGLVVRVSTVKTWLDELLGSCGWGTSKRIGADIDELIPAWTGILLYRVPGATDASGHVDLWKKTTCRIDCHDDFARKATTVELWGLE